MPNKNDVSISVLYWKLYKFGIKLLLEKKTSMQLDVDNKILKCAYDKSYNPVLAQVAITSNRSSCTLLYIHHFPP